MVRVCIYSTFFLPERIGGIEIFTMELASELAKSRHDVTVVTTKDPGQPFASYYNGFKVIRFPPACKTPIICTAIEYERVFQIIKKEKPDILHIMSLSNGWIGLIIKKFLGINYILHGAGDDLYSKYRFKELILKTSIPEAESCFSLTKNMDIIIRKMNPKSTAIVPNAIRISKFDGLSKQQCRQDLGIPENAIIVIYIGRMIKNKGLDYLIESIVEIPDKEVQFWLVGGGDYLSELKLRANKLSIYDERIHFTDTISNNDVPRYLVAADIFVLPSLTEGMPMSIIEAMAAGLPIVATEVGGIPEFVLNGKNGIIVPPYNSEELSRAILELIENDDLASRMSMNNKTKAQEYDINCIAKQIILIYERIFNESL